MHLQENYKWTLKKGSFCLSRKKKNTFNCSALNFYLLIQCISCNSPPEPPLLFFNDTIQSFKTKLFFKKKKHPRRSLITVHHNHVSVELMLTSTWFWSSYARDSGHFGFWSQIILSCYVTLTYHLGSFFCLPTYFFK